MPTLGPGSLGGVFASSGSSATTSALWGCSGSFASAPPSPAPRRGLLQTPRWGREAAGHGVGAAPSGCGALRGAAERAGARAGPGRAGVDGRGGCREGPGARGGDGWRRVTLARARRARGGMGALPRPGALWIRGCLQVAEAPRGAGRRPPLPCPRGVTPRGVPSWSPSTPAPQGYREGRGI